MILLIERPVCNSNDTFEHRAHRFSDLADCQPSRVPILPCPEPYWLDTAMSSVQHLSTQGSRVHAVQDLSPGLQAGHLCVLRARASTISGTAAFSMLSISQYGRIHGWLEQQTTDRVHDAQLTTRVPLEGEKAKTILVPHGGMVSLVSMHIFHGVVALAQE